VLVAILRCGCGRCGIMIGILLAASDWFAGADYQGCRAEGPGGPGCVCNSVLAACNGVS
jgi:hypothetical protein